MSLAGGIVTEKKEGKPTTQTGSTGQSSKKIPPFGGVPTPFKQAELALKGEDPSGNTGTTQTTNKSAQNAFIVSGAIAVNLLFDTVKAQIINAGTIEANNVALKASTPSLLISIAGAAVLNLNSKAKRSAAIAGAIGFDWMQGQTTTLIENSNIVQSSGKNLKIINITDDTLTIDMDHDQNTGDSFVYYQDLSTNNISGLEDGQIYYLIELDGSTNTFQLATSYLNAINGSKIGLGAVNGTDHTLAQGALLSSNRSGKIIAVSAGGAGNFAKKGIAFAGSVSINILNNGTYSTVKNAKITADEISAAAIDHSVVVVVAGAVSYGGTAGIGAGVAFNSIFADTIAEIDNSDLTYNGQLNLDADSTGILVSVAGAVAASKKFGISGTVAVTMTLTKTIARIKDSIINNTQLDSLLSVDAFNDSLIVAISGAIGIGGTAGIGVAIAFNWLDNDVIATILNSTVDVAGDINVFAKENGNIESIVAGGAGAEKAAIAGAIAANLTLNTVKASIEESTIDALGSVSVKAQQSTALHALSGNAAGAGKAAIGASISVNIIINRTEAYILNSNMNIREHLLVDAIDDTQVIALAVGGQGAGNVAIGGSVVIGYIQSNTNAYIKGTGYNSILGDYDHLIDVAGNVGLSAKDAIFLMFIAGVANGAGTVAVGVSVNALVTNNHTYAYIEGVKVKASGKKGTSKIRGADRSESQFKGVAVVAHTNEQVRSFAVVGGGAGTVTVNVSGSVNILVEDTEAFIKNASVNEDDTDADPDQSVIVRAINDTVIWGVAGAINGAGTVAVGVGIDVGSLTKSTLAYIDSSYVYAKDDIIVQSLATVQIISISAAGGGAGTVAVSGVAAVYVLVVNTHAYITGSSSVIMANDSILILAVDDMFALVIVGTANGAGVVAVGGDVQVSSIVKHVTSYVDDNVTIDALSNGDGLTAPTGNFNISWAAKPNTDFNPADISGDVITLQDHGYETGDQVIYNNCNDLEQEEDETDQEYKDRLNQISVGGLNTGQAYYIIKESDNTFRLALTYENAIAGNAITLNKSEATGDTHKIEIAYGITVKPTSINPSSDVVDNKITLQDHGFNTGDSVTYSSGGGEVIGGLEEGVSYYIIKIDANTFMLANRKTAAQNGIAITLDPTFTTGSEHLIWDGAVEDPGTGYQIPGLSSVSDDINNDGESDLDSDSEQDFSNMLNSERTSQVETTTITGLAITAINQEKLITIGFSVGGAGTVAVNVSGAVNVNVGEVKAYIDQGAKVNTCTTCTIGNDQNVILIAAQDLFHIGVTVAIAGSGVVSVTPHGDVNVITSEVKAYINDGATVNAKQDVLIDAISKEFIVTVTAGVSGAGVVGVDASFSVLVLTSDVWAYIGDEDQTDTQGATVFANGNVYVNAAHETFLVAVTGGFGGGQVGVGASVSTKVFSNDVRAFIGPYSTVNAKGQSAGLNGVYQGSMDENGAISTVDDFHGVIVQATNQEKMIGVTVSGSFGLYFGLGGAVSVEVFDSSARAYIGEHAQINPDRTNVDSRQAVHVVAFTQHQHLCLCWWCCRRSRRSRCRHRRRRDSQ